MGLIPYLSSRKERRKRSTTKRLKRLGEKKQVKSILFIPHTTDSKLATLLRDREGKLEETTGDRAGTTGGGGRDPAKEQEEEDNKEDGHRAEEDPREAPEESAPFFKTET